VAYERRLTFGSVAELYDHARPSYPPALVDDVLEFAGAGPGDHALEVGAGTGKATALFAKRGLHIVALEPSKEMAQIARRKLAGYDVVVEQLEFEAWRPAPGFALVFSAQAWHWVTPEIRYTRAREALVDGGALAVFWNWPNWDSSPLRDDLARAYERAAPGLGAGAVGPGPMHPRSHEPRAWWRDWAREIGEVPGFEEPESRTYSWHQDYTADEYVRLIGTHSDHIVLADDQREALLAAVAEVIDGHGGRFALEYVTVLWLARARGGRSGQAG
jgi:SAM-dependent methyltransferase